MVETRIAADRRERLTEMIAQKSRPEKPPRKRPSIAIEYVEAIVIAIVLAFLIRGVVIQAYKIPSGSMEDTLLINDYLLANKFIFGSPLPFLDVRLPGLRDPRPGEIIIFRCPQDPKIDYIKRVIAVGGQTVRSVDKKIFVDGAEIPLPPEGKREDPRLLPAHHSDRDNFGPLVVPKDHFFVMGDNRDNSSDSRIWGFLPKKNIRGKAMVIYFSWDADPRTPLLSKIRWDRIGDVIR